MPRLENFSASVIVDGNPLEEYGIEISTDGKKATSWITSEAGKKFSVKWEDFSRVREGHTRGDITLDGFPSGAQPIVPGPMGRQNTAKRDYLTISDTCTRPYMFSFVELTDDDSFLNSSAFQRIGEIKLDIWKSEMKPCRSLVTKKPPQDRVHERSKKATSHRVKFGEETIRNARPHTHSWVRIGKSPLFTFVFNYRPLDILQANGVVPLTASQNQQDTVEQVENENVKQEQVEDESSDSERIDALEAQVQAFQTQVQALQTTIQALRKNRSGSKNSKRKRVKTGPQTKTSIAKSEVIDLT